MLTFGRNRSRAAQTLTSLQYPYLIGHLLISWAEVVTPAVFLSLSSAVPRKTYMCSWEGYIWLCLDRKMLVMMSPAQLAGEVNHLYNKRWEDPKRSGVEFRSGNSLLLDAQLQLT